MPTKDVSGRTHPGMFEQVTLSNGQKVSPKSGRGTYATYNVNGTDVTSRTGDPTMIEYKAAVTAMEPTSILLTPHNRRTRGRRR